MAIAKLPLNEPLALEQCVADRLDSHVRAHLCRLVIESLPSPMQGDILSLPEVSSTQVLSRTRHPATTPMYQPLMRGLTRLVAHVMGMEPGDARVTSGWCG